MRRVLLAVMPFLPLHRPALGVSLLKAQCEAAGIGCDVVYFTFDYAALIGVADYKRIDGALPTQDLVGEWLFAVAAHGDGVASPAEFRRSVIDVGPLEFYDDEAFNRRLLRLPRLSGPFVAACADKIDLDRYDIVGVTSTFQQNNPSIALAREIKRRAPDVITVLGGGNADGDMGGAWLREVDALDITVSGEADVVFPRLVQRLRSDEPVDDLPGVWSRSGGRAKRPVPVQNLDGLALPDFTEYFDAVAAFEHRDALDVELSVETSRGCWWGERHHCTFCGLNGTSMGYRSKGPERALEELRELSTRWDVQRFFASDNILDTSYFDTVFRRLATEGPLLDLQYEMKSSLRRHQLRALRDAGTTWFQPGIESLSSHVLKLMDKGARAIRHVQVLKWARELGLKVTWNCLCGFPGETGDDYREMLETMRHITHLTPPSSFAVFRVDRFSPMFDEAQERGLRDVKPARAYALCLPFEPQALRDVAYFFECERPYDPDAVAAATHAWIFCSQTWSPQRDTGTLVARVADSLALVEDTRPGWPPRRELLAGVERHVLLAADTAQTPAGILSTIDERHPAAAADAARVAAAIERLEERGWMLREGDLHLSLPLFVGCSDDELGPRLRVHAPGRRSGEPAPSRGWAAALGDDLVTVS